MSGVVSTGGNGHSQDSGAGLESRVYNQGVSVNRMYTDGQVSPYDMLKYDQRDAQIIDRNDGKVVFEKKGIEVPSEWGQQGTDILAEKYMRKTGVPGTGSETSVKQVVHRISHTIRSFGQEHNYFKTPQDAQAFEDELAYMLLTQTGAFNSPVWFNCGLYHDYRIEGAQPEGDWGNWAFNFKTGEVEQVPSYVRPQSSACFIQKVTDSMTGIFDLVGKEAMLFKYGSGTGTNFSSIRGEGEPLSGGGTSSGLMSFLKVFDAGAGATKSGGTTRRAAKMVVLDMDHPDIEQLIRWKADEELKIRALILAGYPSDFEGEAYRTVSGQNSNNSVRVKDSFMDAILADAKYQTIARTSGKVWKEYKAKDLWGLIANAAWRSGDPGIQFDDTINEWHTCKNTGRINASNPCSEYMFLDDTACNLASLNLKKFVKEDGTFDLEKYRHACEIFITAQEILVDLSSYPSKQIAKNSHEFRPLGLGYANLGGLLMEWGLPYNSEEGRSIAGALAAIMTGSAYAQSARIAGEVGTFQEFEKNREPMLTVMRMHKAAVRGIKPLKDFNYLIDAAAEDWAKAVTLGEHHGYRNAQATVMAPTGTIALMMECDTLGIEPELLLRKGKKLAGGGSRIIVNKGFPSALKRLGYKEDEISAIERYVLENNTIEGAPHVKEADYPVFDTSLRSAKGTRVISPVGHILMMAAIQPFVSGAMSKTVNLPQEATPAEIADIYTEAWTLGLKAIAIYRDGSKFSQPLNDVVKQTKGSSLEEKLPRGIREKLPVTREAMAVGGIKIHGKNDGLEHGIFVQTGEYEDDRVGEISVNMYKDGSPFKSALMNFAISVSKGLQHGIPLEVYVDTYLNTHSEPSGFVSGHPYIKSCTSPFDLVMRILGVEYLGRTDLAHIPPDESKLRSNVLKERHELKALKAEIDAIKALRAQKLGSLVQEKTEVVEVKQADNQKPQATHKPNGKDGSNGNSALSGGPPCGKCHSMTILSGKCWYCVQCAESTGGCG